MPDMEYLFVFNEKNSGWYLKIDSVEKLKDYYKQVIPSKYDGAITLYFNTLLEMS